LTVTCNGTHVSCNAGSNGSASVAASGGTLSYSYLWNTTAITSSITGLIAGTYSVTVTDGNGCKNNCSFTVTEPTVLSASCNGTNAEYSGVGTATASVVGSGETHAYTYLWSTTATTSSISGLVANNYSVTVTDSKGCKA